MLTGEADYQEKMVEVTAILCYKSGYEKGDEINETRYRCVIC